MKKLLFAALVVIAIALVFFQSQQPPEAVDEALRHPPAGDLIGFAERYDTYAWLGIPYAQPPLGDLRWRAPRPLAHWQELREATRYGEVCPQFGQLPGSGDRVQGSEDCLTLNIWSPRLAPEQTEDARLPVMVWIHGGGNTIGSSQMGAGYQLAGTQNVIVVSINYRLGLLGWFSHPALREQNTPEDASGNYGLLDQIAALRWVHANIAAFGGDPGNVTIFGESAGARDVVALLASPPAQGLFQRAISQSGSLRTEPVSRAENYRDDSAPGAAGSSRELINQWLIRAGAKDRASARARQQQMSNAELMSWLRAKTPAELLAPVQRRAFGMYETVTNIRDGVVLPIDSLFTVFANPERYRPVPVILGSNRDESKLFMSGDPELVGKRFGVVPAIKDLETYNRITAYFSDGWKALAVDEPAAVLARSQGDSVFVYRFDWDDEPDYGLVNLSQLLGAAHGVDIPFVLGEGGSGLPLLASGANRAGRDLLTRQMMGYWAHFARNGHPGNGGVAGQPMWENRPAIGSRQMIFATAKDGGVRMDKGEMRALQVKQRLNADSRLGPGRRCEIYAQIFLINFHADAFWNQQEYDAMGCAEYPPDSIKPAS